MKTRLILSFAAAALACISCCGEQGPAPELDYRWSVVPIDSTWAEIKDSTATEIIARYSPLLSSLYEVVAVSGEEYTKHRPESALSNFVVDAIHEQAEILSGEKIDLALTNFGGIRTSLPKGEVTLYDIYAIFPFNNYIVVFDIKGSDLIALVRDHARRPEAMSFNTRLVCDRGVVKKFEISGVPVQPDSIYRMASINFLMSGGDDYCLNRYATNAREFPDVIIRDAVVAKLRKMSEGGKPIYLAPDSRAKVIK